MYAKRRFNHSLDRTDMPDPLEISTILDDAARRLEAVSDSARLDAELLLARAIDMPRSYLFAHPEEELDELAIGRFEEALHRRLAGEPMAYITGRKEFWSMQLFVSPATLVPRPETELLVDIALREVPRRADWKILDLGTGSGAIALAIARERPLCQVTGVDNSVDALDVAMLNARELGIANVSFVAGDWTEPVSDQTFELIVSNPPYVREDDEALNRLAHEPSGALVAGHDGLDALRILARDCRDILAPGQKLVLEHGADQEPAVAALLAGHGWTDVICHKDYAGLPRVTVARLPRNCDT